MLRGKKQKLNLSYYPKGSKQAGNFEDEEDASKFLQTLERFKAVSGYEIYAYCLMGNHVHILLKEGKKT